MIRCMSKRAIDRGVYACGTVFLEVYKLLSRSKVFMVEELEVWKSSSGAMGEGGNLYYPC